MNEAGRTSVLGWCKGVINALVIFSWLVVVSIILLATPLVTLMRGYTNGRAYAGMVAQSWMVLVIRLTILNGTHVTFHGDPVPEWSNAIVISNHVSMADPPLLLHVAHRVKALGRLTYIAKESIRYVPFLGWSCVMAGFIFVKRDWMRDARRIKHTFRRVTTNRIPFWLLIFPEGTRASPQKISAAQYYARFRGIHVPSHTLIPKAKGFVAAIHGLHHQLDGVVDVTIVYPDGTPSLWMLLQGRVSSVEFHVRTFPAQRMPTDRLSLERWLIHRFEEKDRLLAGAKD